MKASFISKEKDDVTFKIEFSAEEMIKAIEKTYQENKGRYVLDGFRKGKAPRKLIEAKFGKGVFYEDAINELFSANYPKALDELDIEPVNRPDVEFNDFEEGKELEITLTVTVPPEILVKDYKGLKRPKIDSTVSEEDVDKDIEALRKKSGRLVSVDRPAKEGDNLILDFKGSVDGEFFAGGTAERQTLTLGSGTFIPGFEEQLIGAEIGKECEVKVPFPDDYHAEDLAGKDAVFTCLIHEIKETELPDLDDEFAKDVSVFDTLEEMRQDVRTKLENTAKSKMERESRNAILDRLLEANDFDVPQVMVENEKDVMTKELEQQLEYQGLNMEQYMMYMEKDEDEMRDELQKDAKKRVKIRLLVDAVRKAENIEATDEDVEKEISSMSDLYKIDKDRIKEIMFNTGKDTIKDDICYKKTIDFLFENSVIEE